MKIMGNNFIVGLPRAICIIYFAYAVFPDL